MREAFKCQRETPPLFWQVPKRDSQCFREARKGFAEWGPGFYLDVRKHSGRTLFMPIVNQLGKNSSLLLGRPVLPRTTTNTPLSSYDQVNFVNKIIVGWFPIVENPLRFFLFCFLCIYT